MKKLVLYIIGISTLTLSTLVSAQGHNLEWLTISKDYCYNEGYGDFKDGVCFADYSNAHKTCKNIGGRLPTIDELESEVKNICELKEGMSSSQRKKILKTDEYKTCINNLPFFSRNSYWSSTKQNEDDRVYILSFVWAKKRPADMYSTEWNEYHAQAVSCINDVTSKAKTITPAYIYNSKGCTGCHGVEGEKKALGKSKIIKNMSKEEIVNALKGYNNGTYGGTFKGLMQMSSKKLTEKDMASIADYLNSK